MKVFVYWNLTRGIWSVKALQGEKRGLVINHASHVKLRDCEFRVSEKQRQAVIRTKRKNVHAGVVGYLIEDNFANECERSVSVTYNPYKFSSFVNKQNHDEPIFKASYVEMNSDRVVLAHI